MSQYSGDDLPPLGDDLYSEFVEIKRLENIEAQQKAKQLKNTQGLELLTKSRAMEMVDSELQAQTPRLEGMLPYDSLSSF